MLTSKLQRRCASSCRRFAAAESSGVHVALPEKEEEEASSAGDGALLYMPRPQQPNVEMELSDSRAAC